MNRHDAKDIRPGDNLKPIPLWNLTMNYKLPEVVKVTDIKLNVKSRSGYAVKVDADLRKESWIDAGWFELI